jgi:hypothetical protein
MGRRAVNASVRTAGKCYARVVNFRNGVGICLSLISGNWRCHGGHWGGRLSKKQAKAMNPWHREVCIDYPASLCRTSAACCVQTPKGAQCGMNPSAAVNPHRRDGAKMQSGYRDEKDSDGRGVLFTHGLSAGPQGQSSPKPGRATAWASLCCRATFTSACALEKTPIWGLRCHGHRPESPGQHRQTEGDETIHPLPAVGCTECMPPTQRFSYRP